MGPAGPGLMEQALAIPPEKGLKVGRLHRVVTRRRGWPESQETPEEDTRSRHPH